MRFFNLFVVALSLFFSLSAQADTVWLKNGDRLTGTILVLDGGQLLLKTDYAGTVNLDIKKIATLESEQHLLVKLDNFTTQTSKALRPAPDGSVRLQNGGPEQTIALADIQQLMVPRPIIEDLRWKGNISFSADYKRRENNSDDYGLDVSTELRHGLWRHSVDTEYDYETKNSAKKTERFEASYALDRFITERWFWKNKAKYTHDHLEELRRQYVYGTGPGFQFWDNELGGLAVSALLNHNKFKFDTGEQQSFNASTVSWNYNRYLSGKSFELYTKGEFGAPFIGDIDYVFDGEAGMRYKLNSWAAVTLRAEWDKVSSKYGDLNDRRYVIGVGVGW
ncbi:DUF481 domain-containing protein [Denitrificimonas caeni]|uniref:DUF481 domain-containing protein n=2 Tax=Denitrificimonas caeni TaxID=521720 RepID=A0AAF0AKQ8_9GAMM|nr:DUF481 domain-containing protein [Denitrificimonas caeni]WBE25017.1 DUF481 domain-containing protein [Denitrificimonas caeni]